MDRATNNRDIRDWDRVVAVVASMDPTIRSVLTRTRFSSGQKVHRRGELGEMEGTPGTSYLDPTGEDAAWHDEVQDTTHKVITGMAKTLHHVRVMLEWVEDLNSTDVKKRALVTVPNCLACERPCEGRVRAGFDVQCYEEWVSKGRPDRGQFINEVRERVRSESDAGVPEPV